MPQTFPRDPGTGTIYMLVWNPQKLITEKHSFKSLADWIPWAAGEPSIAMSPIPPN
jgi:hypothetical protein